MIWTIRSSDGTGWVVLDNGFPATVEKFDHWEDAQNYADLRNRGYDHVTAWNEIYREGRDETFWKQKTWTQLLGPYQPAVHFVSGRDIMARVDVRCQAWYRLWTFDSPEDAQRNFDVWKAGG